MDDKINDVKPLTLKIFQKVLCRLRDVWLYT